MPGKRMRIKGKSIGLYGKPQDFLNKIRVPGLESDKVNQEPSGMADEFLLESDGQPKPKRRRRMMDSYGG